MSLNHKLKSGQINYESLKNKGAYSCIVIRDGVIHNMSEDIRLDLIRVLESYAPNTKQPTKTVDLEDMF